MSTNEPGQPSTPRYRSALIIDPDLKFVGAIRADPLLEDREFDFAAGGQSAEALLNDPSVRYSAIFLDPAVYQPTFLSLIRKIRELHPATPVYATHSRMLPLAHPELWKLGIQECLKKPYSPQMLAALTRPSRSASASRARATAHAAAPEDAEYLPVLTEEFLSGRPSPYDVYVQAGVGRFLRILNAKDHMEPDRVQRFIDQGVRCLHIKRQPYARCLAYCDLLASTLILSEDISAEIKLLHLAQQGDHLNRSIRVQGGKQVSAEHLDATRDFLNRLARLVARAKRDQKGLVQEFLVHAAALEHAVAVSFAVALLAPQFGIESAGVWEQVGLAAFFHDIGLYELPDKLITLGTSGLLEDEIDSLSPQEIQSYRRHPIRSVEILSANRAFETPAIQAVLQHHERRDGSGFPGRLGPDQITPLAELVGIADDFARLLKKRSQEEEFDLFATMENQVFDGFSFRTIKAFRAVFM